jgi:hypothetical protein
MGVKMQKIKKVMAIIATAIMAMVVLGIMGCGENKKAESQNTNNAENKPAAQAPAVDPHVIISGFQMELEPAGLPLTAEQQELIIKAFNPATPDDMRPVIGVFTKEQKKVFANIFREVFSKSVYPLTEDQESRIMNLGPGSAEKSWVEILTKEQVEIMMKGNG